MKKRTITSTASNRAMRRGRQGVAASEMQNILLNSSNARDVGRVDDEGEKKAATFASKKGKVR